MGFFDWLSKKPGEEGAPPAADVADVGDADDANSAVVGPPISLEQGAERYEDEGQIAKGGMGVVRKVFNRNLLRNEAMKVLDPKFAEDPNELLRFLEEAQITAQLDHPNIPAVHEIGSDGQSTHFFTMKIVRGQTLEHLLRESTFSIADDEKLFQVLQILIKVCDAIAFAHSRGVIHCDLKPANVMIGRFGQVYVMDWGIARLKGVKRTGRTETGADVIRTMGRDHSSDEGRVLGTLGFMPPEQARGEVDALDERTDVFALGALLYRILTGRAPHVGPTMEDTWELAKRCEVADPQDAATALGQKVRLPPALSRIAMKALRADPATRYSSVAEFHAKLDEFMRGAGRYPTKSYAAGEQIIRQGEKGDQAYVILKGQVRVWRDDNGTARTIRNLGPGEVFGEAAILTDQARSANVDALEALTVVVIARDALERELGHTFWVGHILKAVAERFRDLDTRLQAQLRSVEPALHDATFRYFAFQGQPGEGGSRVVGWTGLRRHLKQSLKLGDLEVMAMTAGIQGLRVDPTADQAVLLPDPPSSKPLSGTQGVVRAAPRTLTPAPRAMITVRPEVIDAFRDQDAESTVPAPGREDPTLPPGSRALDGAEPTPPPPTERNLPRPEAVLPSLAPSVAVMPAAPASPFGPGDSPFQPAPTASPFQAGPSPFQAPDVAGETPPSEGARPPASPFEPSRPSLPASPFEPLAKAPPNARPRSGAMPVLQSSRPNARPPSGPLPVVTRSGQARGEPSRPIPLSVSAPASPPATVLEQPAVLWPKDDGPKDKDGT